MRRSLLLLSIMIVVAAFLCRTLPVRAEDAAALGTSLGNAAISQWGSRDGVNTNMSQPLMSSGTSMKTLDGSTEFIAQLLCPSTRQFLQILVQPVGTGDIGTLMVSQDTDYDGTMDYSFSVASPVSGLCTNGVICCSPGTWTSCTAYQWVADSDGKASLLPVLINDLTGCYCINASCGSNLVWNNLSTVLKTIGGGVVTAIHGTKAEAVVTDVKVDSTTITYYGQDSASCSTIQGASGSTTAQQYYAAPATMTADLETETAAQSADSDSYYSMLSVASESLQAEIRTCQITRAPLFAWEQDDCGVTTYTYDTCATLEADSGCSLRDETVDDVVTVNNYMPTGLSPESTCTTVSGTIEASCSYICPGDTTGNVACLNTSVCTVNGYVATCTNGQCPLDSGVACSSAPTCIMNGQAQLCQFQNPILEAAGYWIGGGPAVTSGNIIRFYDVVGHETGHVTFAPGISATAAITGDSRRCEPPHLSNNVFSVDASSPVDSIFEHCRMEPGNLTFAVAGANISGTLTDGSCFGMQTIYLSTDGQSLYATGWGDYKWEVEGEGAMCFLNATYGAVRLDFTPDHCPLANPTHGCSGTPAVCNKTCDIQTCLDWWRKSRTYVCASSSYDFTDIRRRVKTIRDSAGENGGTASYTDLRKDSDGNWLAATQHTFTMPSSTSSSTCTKACKTRKSVFNTEATTGWSKSSYTNLESTYCFYYRACTDDVCPVGDGEEIITDCQCVNEFAEAAAIMQTLRLGAQDMICSDGTKKLLE